MPVSRIRRGGTSAILDRAFAGSFETAFPTEGALATGFFKAPFVAASFFGATFVVATPRAPGFFTAAFPLAEVVFRVADFPPPAVFVVAIFETPFLAASFLAVAVPALVKFVLVKFPLVKFPVVRFEVAFRADSRVGTVFRAATFVAARFVLAAPAGAVFDFVVRPGTAFGWETLTSPRMARPDVLAFTSATLTVG